jgi:hypothetical protein
VAYKEEGIMKKIVLIVCSVLLSSCVPVASSTTYKTPEWTVSSISKEIIPTNSVWAPGIIDPSTLTTQQISSSIPVKIKFLNGNEAPIQPVGLDYEGRVGTISDAKTVGWYKHGPSPGSKGNAILDGHRDWNGEWGSLRFIEHLEIGENVEIEFQDGSSQIFYVFSNDIYSLVEVPSDVMDLSGQSRVTIITCAGKYERGKGGYQSRVVVVLK